MLCNEKTTFTRHTGNIFDVGINMNNKFIISGGEDRAVRVYRIKTSKQMKTLRGGHRDWIIRV